MRVNSSVRVRHIGLLVLAALLWGMGFAALAVGAEYVGPFTFLFIKSALSFATILPVVWLSDRWMRARYGIDQKPKSREEWKTLWKVGAACGVCIFFMSYFQQVAIPDTGTGKAGFITSMYIIIVPLLKGLLGGRTKKEIWLAALVSALGVWLLCGAENLDFGKPEWLLLGASFSGAVQILLVEKYGQRVDGVRLSAVQFLVMTGICAAGMLLWEEPTVQTIAEALPAILYSGIVGGGAAYTLQIIGQRGVDSTSASLAMCLESVFSAVGGWLILHQTMSGREILGCALMFTGVLISTVQQTREEP